MGNSSKKYLGNTDFGDIYVMTDKAFYFSGELVTGMTVFYVRKCLS